jgi:hypothetical protein
MGSTDFRKEMPTLLDKPNSAPALVGHAGGRNPGKTGCHALSNGGQTKRGCPSKMHAKVSVAS